MISCGISSSLPVNYWSFTVVCQGEKVTVQLKPLYILTKEEASLKRWWRFVENAVEFDSRL
jgi:hypothetical protein